MRLDDDVQTDGMTTGGEPIGALWEWLVQHAERVEQAFLRACLRIDQITEMQTDPEASDTERIRQKVDTVFVAVGSILREAVADEFWQEFSDVSEQLRLGLQLNAWSVIHENMDYFKNLLAKFLTKCTISEQPKRG